MTGAALAVPVAIILLTLWAALRYRPGQLKRALHLADPGRRPASSSPHHSPASPHC
ncbi:MAG: hypothetical protein R2839_04215 [Thermomicrobiales bacterium]